MSFNADDYVDVAERIAEFYKKFPEGSLQGTAVPFLDGAKLIGWSYKAFAYRTPGDPVPGVGHAWEPVPGLTNFTRGSELMNAETSAWGRAIVAAGIPSKKIASANEVRNRDTADHREAQGPARPAAAPVSAPESNGALLCPRCGSVVKGVPAGVSKKTGMSYDAFTVCSAEHCAWKATNQEPAVRQSDPVTAGTARRPAADVIGPKSHPGKTPPNEDDFADPGFLASLEASLK